MGELMLSKELFERGKRDIEVRLKKLSRKVKVALFMVGNDASSKKYISLKGNDFKKLGVEVDTTHYSSDISPEDLNTRIEQLNNNSALSGYIMQLPLPFPLEMVISKIDAKKDIDAFDSRLPPTFSLNSNMLSSMLYPCTAKAVIYLLDSYGLLDQLIGREVLIIGNGITAGRPLAKLLLHSDTTLIVCNKFTDDIESHMKRADILISAAGAPRLVRGECIKKGAVVINIGLSKGENGLVGDVDEPSVIKRCSLLAPSHGSIGLLTRLMVLENTLLLAERFQC